ncbi:hypothetical protein PIB30_089626 [Stylosanthes scabra]|uniref:Uncharacterized protein n=1 Tax=Stylosanthes scabra TaxID=79078 RepID=A0ABU6VSQ9_9FABA|nr:hypothetical protein [Stylosanthes scabra]
MITLFKAFLKGTPITRNIPDIREDQIGSSSLGINAQRVLIKALEALPFEGIHYRTPIIRTDVKKIGLLNALGDSDGGRIKSFTIREAIRYSYLRDIRFVTCLCASLGFGIWWNIAPEPLLLNPAALSSPDLSTLLRVARDTFLDQICSSHPHVTSPCDCGEPLNNTARLLLNEPERFDPLGIQDMQEDVTLRGQALKMDEAAHHSLNAPPCWPLGMRTFNLPIDLLELLEKGYWIEAFGQDFFINAQKINNNIESGYGGSVIAPQGKPRRVSQVREALVGFPSDREPTPWGPEKREKLVLRARRLLPFRNKVAVGLD